METWPRFYAVGSVAAVSAASLTRSTAVIALAVLFSVSGGTAVALFVNGRRLAAGEWQTREPGDDAERLVATTGPELEIVSGHVHDLWLTLDALVHDRAHQLVRIPLIAPQERPGRFGGIEARMGTKPAGTLTIRKVRDLQVDDTEKVGAYEIDTVSLLSEPDGASVVELQGTIPLRIACVVESVDVEFDAPS